MGLMYFFDKRIKPRFMKGKYYCNPAKTGKLTENISCIRQGDVNVWFYTKGKDIIAIDAGHLNYPNTKEELKAVGIKPDAVKNVFITHADVDHCGGIDIKGNCIFPQSTIYIGEKEEQYLSREMYRMKKVGLKIYNDVCIGKKYVKLFDGDVVSLGKIRVKAIESPGHTAGHMCYLVDNKVLFSGDCLAVNEKAGYAFFDFFTQFPALLKESLVKLKQIAEETCVQYICTGHSGFTTDIEKAFMNIDKSAIFGKKRPFDTRGPYDYRKE